MNSFAVIWYELRRESADIVEDLNIWLARLTDAEKIIGVCVLVLLMIAVTARTSGGPRKDRSEMFQFTFAMALVVMAGFGVGWLFSDPPELKSFFG